MCKKLLFLITFVLVLGLVSSASADVKLAYRACWWSDLGSGHLWSEPNNWWTMDKFYDDLDDSNSRNFYEPMWYVKEPNQVPDINCAAIIGKGTAREPYPLALREMILDGYVMTDPTFDANTWYANWVLCGGGDSFDPNVGGGAMDPDANHYDPNVHHYLWMTGGTLNIGEPQLWEGYEDDAGWGEFNGQGSPGRLCIGTLAGGSGTMYMSGGTTVVNVGGHVEVGAWAGGIGLLDMTGGTINITQGFYCPSSWWGAVGHTNLHGGTINARYLLLQTGEGSTGSMDITEGKMILERNEVEKIQDYFDGKVDRASITVYGVGHGDIDPCTGKRAAFSLDYGVSNENKTTMQAFVTDPCQAWAPDPPTGATGVRGPAADVERPILSWSPRNGAASHNVYFGTSFADVNDANTSSAESKEVAYDPCSWTVDTDLVSLGTYYWRIDENPGPTKGQVWDFTMANLAKASLPSPGDGATDVNPVVDLSWVAGISASSHDVYFGTNFDDVNDANTLVDPNKVFMGNQGPNTFDTNNYDANGLEFNTTYYWRVDGNAPSLKWPGDVWRFTTSDHITVDDMDSYGPDPALRTVWKDYYYDTKAGNLAELFIEVEPTLVRSGQSMMYYFRTLYKSAGKIISCEAEASTADLEIGSDWVSGGPEALVLYFYGDPTNLDDSAGVINGIHQDQMYVAVYDGSTEVVVEYDGDMNDIKKTSWQEWNIDLKDFSDGGIALSNVTKMYIGFGGQRIGQTVASVTGDTVWFDDIGLWPIRCVPSAAYPYGDFTEDCVVNEQDLDLMAGDWLVTDYNTTGYNAILKNYVDDDSQWTVDGVIDGALRIAETNDCETMAQQLPYVEVPPLDLYSNTVTITAWVKRDGDQCDWGSGIVFCRDGDTVAGINFGNKAETCNKIQHHWNDKYWGWEPGLPEIPDATWTFVGLVVSPDNATIYQRVDGGTLYDALNAKSYALEEFNGITCIGQGVHNQPRNVIGWMDDTRIYNRSLSPSEIDTLSSKSGEPSPGPFSWFKFDDGSGLVAEDSGGGVTIYHEVPSQANLVDPEAQYSRSVNFRDYAIMANNWLEEILWPQR